MRYILVVPESKFPLGQLVATSGVAGEMETNPRFAEFVARSLQRHAAADWGDLSQDDWEANDQALREGGRLFSAYQEEGLPKIWIITEWDRSVTTILFPEEY